MIHLLERNGGFVFIWEMLFMLRQNMRRSRNNKMGFARGEERSDFDYMYTFH